MLIFYLTIASLVALTLQEPPPFWEHAKFARYVINQVDWVSLSTISTYKGIEGFPFATVKSISDGQKDNSTGKIYFYMSDIEMSQKDLNANNKCTVLATLSETGYCESKKKDAQDPTCGKVIITGKLIKLDKLSDEYNFGLQSLYYKHPAMKSWPSEHGFFVSKLEIAQILVLDFYGGASNVTAKAYYEVKL